MMKITTNDDEFSSIPYQRIVKPQEPSGGLLLAGTAALQMVPVCFFTKAVDPSANPKTYRHLMLHLVSAV